ncbi:CYTH domain-containing protein [Pseudomonas putida]|uniref:CYTH domain-containing protein n=1 Tax=Pseudomonas putida TaxID=303 RepID=A0A8I1ECF2_PSEPU|nr:CYTH domain-containing protein [Pseudomonas putida]MBI6882797.1 CYTH domain-containing protein [Pseudomonas putida]
MLVEIERKFRVKNDSFIAMAAKSLLISQGYLCSAIERTVRVRVQDREAFITVKGIGDATGASRFEWEKSIDPDEAMALMRLTEPSPIEKRRYRVLCGAHWWDVDVFLGDNEGLILAEVELTSIDESFEKPDWLGEEVTGDPRFYNSYLSKKPFKNWSEHER